MNIQPSFDCNFNTFLVLDSCFAPLRPAQSKKWNNFTRTRVHTHTHMIQDFGVAARRIASDEMSTKTGVGTHNWNPSEVYEPHYKQQTFRDIWALGMIIYEVMTRKVPYEGLKDLQIGKKMLTKELPDMTLVEKGAPDGLFKVFEACCQFEPNDRPTADVVVREMTAVLKALRNQKPSAGPPRSIRHHDDVLKILAAIQEEQKRQAAEIASIAAAMNDLRENLHNEVRC